MAKQKSRNHVEEFKWLGFKSGLQSLVSFLNLTNIHDLVFLFFLVMKLRTEFI